MKKTYFTPGPAQLYPTFEKHLQAAVEEQLGSISHRSRRFRSMYQETAENLRALLNIPAGNQIVFTSSATEIWERSIQNLVGESSFHLVNGSFSQKFYDFSVELGKNAIKQDAEPGKGFEVAEVQIPIESELVCLTHNETSFGVMFPASSIHALQALNPEMLFIVDMVSSAPYPELDFTKIDSAFFSVQKGFGLPPGLGVWIVNEKCLAKAEKLKAAGHRIGTYHSLPLLWKNALSFETPSTPNVVSIYLLGKIAGDMLQKGIQIIRRETAERAAEMYGFLEKSEKFKPLVQNKAHRSPTVLVTQTSGSQKVIDQLAEQYMVVGSGYGNFKESQLRIANFPATTEAEWKRLLKMLATV
jgi:phosphoserine aminotransferase